MSAIIAGWMPLKKLKEIVETLEGKGETGFKMTIAVNDDSNEYGQNVSLFAEQSKEQREAKADRYFCGNGRVIWTNDKIVVGTKVTKNEPIVPPSDAALNDAKTHDDLPF
jgi:hypothetical protein